ncbi:aldo/keto reductase, partial [Paraburkholderia sp. SIMBA_027]
QSEYSLLQRKAEDELVPAVEDAGLGLMAWAPLGRGVLTGKYRGQIPADSRAADGRLAGYVAPYLEPQASRVVEAVAMAARGLGRSAMDVSLSWLL